MHKVTCPMYLHDIPMEDDDHEESAFEHSGIHFIPHYSKDYPGYYRVVFVYKDGGEKTDPYQVPGRVWDRLNLLLEMQ